MTTVRAYPRARTTTRLRSRTAGPWLFINACMLAGAAVAAAGVVYRDRFPYGPVTAREAVLGGLAIAVGCWLIRRTVRAVNRAITAKAPPLRHVTDAERHRLGSAKWRDKYDDPGWVNQK